MHANYVAPGNNEARARLLRLSMISGYDEQSIDIGLILLLALSPSSKRSILTGISCPLCLRVFCNTPSIAKITLPSPTNAGVKREYIALPE